MTLNKLKFVNYIYNTKERWWVKVGNIEGQNVYGKISNSPITNDILFGESGTIKLCDSVAVLQSQCEYILTCLS